MPVLSLACHLPHNTSVGEKLSWFIRHLSDGLYIFYMNLWNFPSDIWAWPSEMSDVSYVFRLHCNTPHIPSRYNNEQTTKQTKAINNSYIYINISCKCDTNRAGHFTLDAYASRPVACFFLSFQSVLVLSSVSAQHVTLREKGRFGWVNGHPPTNGCRD